MAYLLDTNVLLRLMHRADPAHTEVRQAVRRLHERGERLHFAPQNAAELWNVATRPTARNGLGLAPAAVHTMLSLLERLLVLLPEVREAYPAWRTLIREANVSGVQVHDARLVVTCSR